MTGFVIFMIVIMALLTAAALARGIFIMASGRDVSGRQSNKLMWYRVLFQGITIAFVALLLLMAGGRG
jgi:hypothetical protein